MIIKKSQFTLRLLFALKRMLKRLNPSLYEQLFWLLKVRPYKPKWLTKLAEDQTLRQLKRNEPMMLINLNGKSGLGWMLTLTLGILKYSEKRNLMPVIRFTNPLYSEKASKNCDWLEHLFASRIKPIKITKKIKFVNYNTTIHDLILDSDCLPDAQYSGLEDHDLFFKYFSIRQCIIDETKEFCQLHNVGFHTIGIHFRGTDKSLEVRPVEWATIFLEARKCLIEAKFKNIFVASDEPEFIQQLELYFGNKMVIHLDCKEIFNGNRPAHLTPGNEALKRSEAMKTIILLSMCGRLIRTSSHLSAWCKIINPFLEVTTLS